MDWYINEVIYKVNQEGKFTDSKGNEHWYKNSFLHREDRPAIELIDGTKFWFLNAVQTTEDVVMTRWNAIQEKKSLEEKIKANRTENNNANQSTLKV